MNVFSGVPVWNTGTIDEPVLYFGDEGKDSFFTYDFTKDGDTDFVWPFTTALERERGTLSSWWAGCEPVCDMVNKIIGTGVFYSKPWNQALGHVFRKDVPRLVFVFSNEFDNSLSRIMLIEDEEWHYENVEVLALPTIYAKWVNTDMKVTEKKIYKDSFTCFVNIRGELNEQQTPPDPYCMQMTKVDKLDMEAFLNKINITAE